MEEPTHVQSWELLKDQKDCNIYSILLYFSQKQLPRETKTRLVITKCAGYIFWQSFL